MNAVKKPLKKSFLAGIAILIVSLCVSICALQYISISHTFYQSYQDYIGNVLRYAAAKIDTDDLAECIRTGVESEKYRALQKDLDEIKENISLHFLYVVVPLNTEKTDNIQNVIAAATAYEYEYESGELVRLNTLTGDSYSPAAAKKYLDAYQSGELSFFEETSAWGRDLTGLLPLFDSGGKPVAALCMDIEIPLIREKIVEHLLNTAVIILSIGLLFASVFIVWADKSILKPVRILEEKAADVLRKGLDPDQSDAIVLDVPEVNTPNELGALARSVEKMSRGLRDYMNTLIAKEKELARFSTAANRDDLTHVGNLNAYNAYAEKLQLQMTEEKAEFAILAADVDDQKKLNDTCGRERGDLYLKNCCALICDVFRHSPVFRVGGDEFAVILIGEDFQNRRDLVRTVRERFRHSRANEDAAPWDRLSVSVGIADYQEGVDSSVEDVFRRADHAMYEARNLRVNNF